MRVAGRFIVAAAAAVVVAAGATAAAGAPVPTPITPAAGQAVLLTPPAGFANGDVNLTWSIVYDCPGPAGIHSSYVHLRRPGDADWQSEQRGGPFLGDGQFSVPATFFPTAQPAAWEWRVFWACGATGGFAGAQGTSDPVPFTVALPPAPAPPAPTAPTAPTPTTPAPQPCAGRTGSALVICRARLARNARLTACAKIAKAKRRAACRVTARARYTRTVRLQRCAAKTGEKRRACIRSANAAYRRAVT
jgi:hypothetical protein